MIWFNKWDSGVITDLKQDPEYTGRVEYHKTTDKDSTRRIKDLRESDSVEYKFRFRTNRVEWGYSFPGTTLTVTDLQVKVTPATEKGKVNLTCSTTCSLADKPTYIWYKNGQPVIKQTTLTSYLILDPEDRGRYSCDLEDLHSPPVCVVGQNCLNVSYTHESICALKGSTVNISCTFNHLKNQTVTNMTWFNKWDSGVITDLKQDPEYTGRVEYHKTTDKDSTLRIKDLRESDSVEYKFRFISNRVEWGYSFPGTILTVTDLQVKVINDTENGKVNLTCSTTCSLTDKPTYIWYKNGQLIDELISHQHSVKRQFTDSYSCSVLDLRSPVVCAVGKNCLNVSYTHESICALKGSTVNISCTFNHLKNQTATNMIWFNKWDSGVITDLKQDPEYTGRVEYHKTTDKDSTLRIKDLRESDSVEYKFRFITNKAEWGYSFPGTTLTVTDLQVKVTPATEKGKVNLTCSTTCSLTDKPTYIWYKNGQPLTKQTTLTSYLILDPEDRGRYSCGIKGLKDSVSHEFSVGEPTFVNYVVVGIIVAVVILILCLSGFIWFRKKTSKSTSDRKDTAVTEQRDSSHVYDNISDMVLTSTAAQTTDTDNQDHHHYDRVHLCSSKKQEVPLYSIIQLP
ncbi:hypothetical protein DPEC_G00171780 [Dallia pectoralis]|uniref:Uncharacterized protein n=1 Tax=Dallia pectoralis TaxID=75939 RepID=A0ACC2GDG7_DALPE|nr:hypothetical protein DPEC_G00171780 [Dallia pectoralis]